MLQAVTERAFVSLRKDQQDDPLRAGMPQIVDRIGVAGALLLLGGGIAYSLGAVVYVRKWPDPRSRTFGYHEVFHVLVILAVACQYHSVAFFLLPRA